jgi:SAM-dependent methyltransferase
MNKPFATAADENKEAIAAVLLTELSNASEVLEIGSGTGQHAVHFSQLMPHLRWHCSDQGNHIAGIQLWLESAGLNNTPPAFILDVNQDWPQQVYDAAFASNIAHIMHWSEIECLFEGLSQALGHGAYFYLYGPFSFNAQFSSESNQVFDQYLRQKDPLSGLRDKNELDQLALSHRLMPAKCWALPANNHILSWQKT